MSIPGGSGGSSWNTPEYNCFHCGSRCGGKLATGYGALTGEFTPDHAIHASCHPDDPATHPDCWLRVTVHGEPAGALRDVRPLPVGVEDIRKAEVTS
jgi:hypothetical protein